MGETGPFRGADLFEYVWGVGPLWGARGLRFKKKRTINFSSPLKRWF